MEEGSSSSSATTSGVRRQRFEPSTFFSSNEKHGRAMMLSALWGHAVSPSASSSSALPSMIASDWYHRRGLKWTRRTERFAERRNRKVNRSLQSPNRYIRCTCNTSTKGEVVECPFKYRKHISSNNYCRPRYVVLTMNLSGYGVSPYGMGWVTRKGTMGLFTTISYSRTTERGDMDQSRSRLEVYPAACSPVSAGCKPTSDSWQFAKNLRLVPKSALIRLDFIFDQHSHARTVL